MCYNIAVRRKGVCMDFELLQWEPSLAPSLAESANDARISRWLRDAFPYPYSIADAQKFIHFAQNAGDSELNFAIVAAGRAVGGASLTRQPDVYRKSAELGYWLNPAFWGGGVMTEAVGRVCAEGFARWDIVRIFAEPFAGNAASRRVLEKCGFALEGVKKRSVYKNGEFSDSCMYALIKE